MTGTNIASIVGPGEHGRDWKLVLDTAAFVSGPDSLFTGAAVDQQHPELYTVESVVLEVRDARARSRLAALQQGTTTSLHVCMPTSEALTEVSRFARLTGDYGSLSAADIRVLALVWMLEVEVNGPKYIRQQLAGHAPNGNGSKRTRRRRAQRRAMKARETVEEVEDAQGEEGLTTVSRDAQDMHTEPTREAEALEEVPRGGEGVPAITDDVEDDGIGWIGEENLEEQLAQDIGGLTTEKAAEDDGRMFVGCVTADFAMQNVLLQMGLQLVSPDGERVIKQVRRFVLRCEGCFKTTRDMEKQFCPHCGNNTLAKVPYLVDENGNTKVMVDPRRQAKVRGTKYPLPLPKGGRHNTDLILAEDQLMMRTPKQRAKAVDVFDPAVAFNPGAKFNPHRPVEVGYGRRNPNQVQKRTRGKNKN
eukprot:Plantae.Rhodophyta-Rhodochaete_pulchella.ctg1907.p1 GENE.Plantae.Rhodophyta-Rhodochaete_pulchella.ctg1907~~Plantae.Rhodophyta-Rhodochaete_pulchella.ctg1907.p1  ORF type:complete len:418 (+),score=63.36 Plantae.Rhodophyta-Rhodochaete_pulchella.ctg1907:56-1309(+)